MKITNLNKVSIIGLGMMGGSLAAALKNQSFSGEIFGYARDQSICKNALDSGIVDKASDDIKDAVCNADLIVMCLPIDIIIKKSIEIRPFLKPQTLVTDIGSTKKDLVNTLSPLYCESDNYFIGSHPICGSEKKGLDSLNKNLYENKLTVICADEKTPKEILQRLIDFWHLVGCNTVVQDSNTHDQILASTSHLPHIISSLLVLTIHQSDDQKIEDIANACGTGYLDMTRLASGSSDIWKDILSTNNENIIKQLSLFEESINELKKILESKDKKKIKLWLEKASMLREEIISISRFL